MRGWWFKLGRQLPLAVNGRMPRHRRAVCEFNPDGTAGGGMVLNQAVSGPPKEAWQGGAEVKFRIM